MIKIGTSLMLERIEKEEVKRYRCKVIEQSNELLFVDYPINEITGRTGIFERGTEFLVQFIGKDNSVYQFATELKGKEKLKIPSLLLSRPLENELKRIQRREYLRIESATDIAIHHPAGDFPPFTSLTYDLSGGGLTFYLPDNFQVSARTKIQIWLILPREEGKVEYIQAMAETVRKTSGKGERKNMLSVKFKEIEDKDRQAIIRYCFDRQLRDRRRKVN